MSTKKVQIGTKPTNKPAPAAADAWVESRSPVAEADQIAQEQPEKLLYSAALVIAVGMLMVGWGVFVHLNRSAEELEPEAMEEAKSEDRKVSNDH